MSYELDQSFHNQPNNFEYAEFDTEIQAVIKQRAYEIRVLAQKSAQQMVEIGEKLREIKKLLKHGQFRKWLKSEFGWSLSTATKLMQVSREFKSVNFTDLSFSTSALYLLAAPSTPEEARQEALQLAKRGYPITWSRARKIVENYNHNYSLKSKKISDSLQEISVSQKESYRRFLISLKQEWLRLRRQKNFLSIIFLLVDESRFPRKLTASQLQVVTHVIENLVDANIKRPADRVTKIGEEKFVIMLPETPPQGAYQLAEKLKKGLDSLSLDTLSFIDEGFIPVSISVESVLPTKETSLEQFVSIAEDKLDQTKIQGKNTAERANSVILTEVVLSSC
jgi:diguanylate cyclase (GGDEF)-like protein